MLRIQNTVIENASLTNKEMNAQVSDTTEDA